MGLSWNDFVDFVDFAEDVWHGIQQAASAVMHWVVDIVHKTVDLLTQIGDELVLLAGMVVDGIREVISIVHSICNRIAAFVEKIIDWLRAFFDWGDIWDTKKALEAALLQSVPFLGNFVQTRAQPLVNGFFSGLGQNVINAFAAGRRLVGLHPRIAELRLRPVGEAGSHIFRDRHPGRLIRPG
jgi:hypothetical protein